MKRATRRKLTRAERKARSLAAKASWDNRRAKHTPATRTTTDTDNGVSELIRTLEGRMAQKRAEFTRLQEALTVIKEEYGIK